MNSIMSLDRQARPIHYAWPGGYEVAYYWEDGERCCYQCLITEDFEALDPVSFADIYWEGPTEYCANCNAECTSEYGDPDVKD